MPKSKARQRRESQAAEQVEEQRKKRLNEARLRLFGLMLIMVGCLGGLFFLPPATTPIPVTILLTAGVIVALALSMKIAVPILDEMRGSSGQGQ